MPWPSKYPPSFQASISLAPGYSSRHFWKAWPADVDEYLSDLWLCYAFIVIGKLNVVRLHYFSFGCAADSCGAPNAASSGRREFEHAFAAE